VPELWTLGHFDALMQSDIPQSVEPRDGYHRCVRLADGRFHLVKPGPLATLFYGGDSILASETFAGLLRELCSHCLDFRCAEIVQIATGERFGTYFEVLPRDKITPESIRNISAQGFHVWRYGSRHLFVTPAVAEEIQKRGFDDISFSPGFTHFAAAAA
jgi:hypothetical protein